MLKQSLQQKLGLKINPLQIQIIKMLEMPTYQLEQRIKEELEQNPLLEEAEERPEPEEEYPEERFGNEEEGDYGEDEREDYASAEDDFSLEDYMSDDDLSDYRLASSNASPDGESRDFVVSQGASFRESLIGQLGTRPLSDLEHKISEYIIGNIDDDGYLRRDVESIVDDLAFGVGVEVDEEQIMRLLRMICGSACCCRWSAGARRCLTTGRWRMRGISCGNASRSFPKSITRRFPASCVSATRI